MLESVYRKFYANVRWPPGPGPGLGAVTSYPNTSWVIPIYETYTGISQDILTCPRVVFSDVTWLRLNSEVNSLPVSSAASLRLPVNIHWDGLRLGCQWAESNPSSCLQARARAFPARARACRCRVHLQVYQKNYRTGVMSWFNKLVPRDVFKLS